MALYPWISQIDVGYAPYAYFIYVEATDCSLPVLKADKLLVAYPNWTY